MRCLPTTEARETETERRGELRAAAFYGEQQTATYFATPDYLPRFLPDCGLTFTHAGITSRSGRGVGLERENRENRGGFHRPLVEVRMSSSATLPSFRKSMSRDLGPAERPAREPNIPSLSPYAGSYNQRRRP